MFKCNKCGLCCKNIRKSVIYSHLDRGDGVCKYFCDETHLCSIYENRPDICNVDKMYEMHYSKILPINEFYKLNKECCIKLKDIRGDQE